MKVKYGLWFLLSLSLNIESSLTLIRPPKETDFIYSAYGFPEYVSLPYPPARDVFRLMIS